MTFDEWKDKFVKKDFTNAENRGIIDLGGEEVNDDKKYDEIYETAKNGGRHFGTYKQGIKKTGTQLDKSIRSYKEKIAEHQNKVKNPELYDLNWDNMDLSEKDGTLRHWKKEIQNFSDESEILMRIKRERETYE